MIYNYSFAELCDRASIVVLKIAHSENPEAFNQELKDILSDIQIHLDSKPVNAEQIKGLIVLSFANQFIFLNEENVRNQFDNNGANKEEMLSNLIKTHKVNSIRSDAKRHIQTQREERTDQKLNFGKSSGLWNINW